MSLLTSQHINRMCSQHTPKQYHRLVTGYTKHIASWPCDLDSVILFHAFYEKIFPNLCNKIQSPISSDEEREKMIIDMMSLLSLQRNKKWDDTIIDVLGMSLFHLILLLLIISNLIS